MKKHKIITIEQTAQIEIVKFMHKCLNNMLSDAFDDFFQHNHRNCDTGRSRSRAKVFFFLFAIFILHSRESELYCYVLYGKFALAWELLFPWCLGPLSST